MTTKTLVEMFNEASKKLRFPRIKYPHQNGHIIFSLASKAVEPHFPNLIYIKFESETKGNYYLGAISKKNELQLNIRETPPCDVPLLIAAIKTIHEQSLECFKMMGQKFSYCCFCGTEITSKNSLAVGYGPICAEKFGLPWDGEAERLATEGDL